MNTDYLIWAVQNKQDLAPTERSKIADQLRRETMSLKNHVQHLKFEIEQLRTMVKEHDTGHIITAIQVLENRIAEMESVKEEVLDSSYPDGDGYWK